MYKINNDGRETTTSFIVTLRKRTKKEKKYSNKDDESTVWKKNIDQYAIKKSDQHPFSIRTRTNAEGASSIVDVRSMGGDFTIQKSSRVRLG